MFTTWVVSYIDRMVISVSIPFIAKDFHLSPLEMGVVMSAFFAGYATCQIPGGILADRFGARIVMTFAILWWSIFTFLTGVVTSLGIMLGIRVVFGVGEGLFPAGSWKSISNWFPVKERATANAIMLSSNPLGPALAPLFVVAVITSWGWRGVFKSLFVPGIIVAFLVWKYVTNRPQDSKHVSAQELAEIESVEPEIKPGVKVTWVDCLKLWRVWQCFLMWFAFDITLWGFTAWLPTYLIKARGFGLVNMGIAASLPFFAGTIGLIAGGWLSDKWFSNSRKIPVILTQLAGAVFLYLTYTVSSATGAVVYQTLAGGVLYVGMGAFWALPMNIIPKDVMGTASGLINTAGQTAGFLAPMAIGYLVQISGGSFNAAFMLLIAGVVVSSLIALTVKEKKAVAVAAATQ
jgi:sugar phosphate permease